MRTTIAVVLCLLASGGCAQAPHRGKAGRVWEGDRRVRETPPAPQPISPAGTPDKAPAPPG
jgi:hypothetical protein